MTRRRRLKARREAGLRLRAPRAALFALTVLLARDGTGVLRLSLVCALLHEAGHVLAYRALLHRWPAVQASLFGCCLVLRGVLLRREQELILAAAGPLTNLALCCAAFMWMECFGYTFGGYWFASANLLLGAANLLPVPPLDGARILQSFL